MPRHRTMLNRTASFPARAAVREVARLLWEAARSVLGDVFRKAVMYRRFLLSDFMGKMIEALQKLDRV